MGRRRTTLLLLPPSAALIVAAGFGCSDELPPASRVDKMRLLAIRAEPPEIGAGEHTALDALVAQPLTPSPAPALSFLWMACRQAASAQLPAPCGITALGNGGPEAFGDPSLPGEAPSGMATCTDAPGAPLCLLGTTATVDYAPALDGDQAVTQLLVTLVVADQGPGSALACARAAASSGTGAPPDVDHCTIALKRVNVRSATASAARNENPRFAALTLGGASLPGGAATFPRSAAGVAAATAPIEVRRCTSATVGSDGCTAGAAAQVKDDGSHEVLFVSWFTTAGAFAAARSSFGKSGCSGECLEGGGDKASTTFTAPDADELALRAPGGAVHFWAVVRDDRGGVGWLDGGAAAR